MGKLKQSIIVEQEEEFNAVEQAFNNRAVLARVRPATQEEWVAWGMANQQEWSEFTKEFEAWLDAYESSFGSEL